MAILSGVPVLSCKNIEISLDFYLQFFQFVIVKKRQPDDSLLWVHIMHGETSLMLEASDSSATETEDLPRSTIALHFFVDNIRELHHFIKAKNYSVSDITITDYRMQLFNLRDPEGNEISVGMAADTSL